MEGGREEGGREREREGGAREGGREGGGRERKTTSMDLLFIKLAPLGNKPVTLRFVVLNHFTLSG